MSANSLGVSRKRLRDGGIIETTAAFQPLSAKLEYDWAVADWQQYPDALKKRGGCPWKKQKVRNRWLTGSLIFSLPCLPPSRPGGQVSGGDRDRAAALRRGGRGRAGGTGTWEMEKKRKQKTGETDSLQRRTTDSLIEYGELEELLKRGNASLKSAVSQYDTNLEIYQEAKSGRSSHSQSKR